MVEALPENQTQLINTGGPAAGESQPPVNNDNVEMDGNNSGDETDDIDKMSDIRPDEEIFVPMIATVEHEDGKEYFVEVRQKTHARHHPQEVNKKNRFDYDEIHIWVICNWEYEKAHCGNYLFCPKWDR